MDRPNDRSSHLNPRPRGGGIGVIVGSIVGLGFAMAAGTVADPRLLTILGAGCVVAAVGLWDDVASLSPAPRLAVHLSAAGLVVWVSGGFDVLPLPAPLDQPVGAMGAVLALVWIVGVTNFFNFMDGADGLAGGQAGLTFGALALVLWPSTVAVVALAVVAATLAFLCRNWSPARIFLGDVGSGWLGFVLAALPFAGPVGRREDLVMLVATSLALFLIDPSVTLIRRFLRGASVTASHREHAYQRLIVPGRSHAGPVGVLLVAASTVTMAGVFAFQQPAWLWISLVWAAGVGAVEWIVAGYSPRQVTAR